MQKGKLLYEGKAKKLYGTEDDSLAVMHFKDDATAFDGEKKASLEDKGLLNNAISSRFFQLLAESGIATHFREKISAREMLVERVEIIPLEVVARNAAAGSLQERLGLKKGSILKSPILEFYYKSDELGDPLLNRHHIEFLGAADEELMQELEDRALRINDILREFLRERNIQLVDFKLEFGHNQAGDLLLADEITPDTCRFWDGGSGRSLDKDRFRQDLGEVMAAYREIADRLNIDTGEVK